MRALGPRRLEEFGDILKPGEALEPILAKPVRDALLEWMTEIWAADALAEVGLVARRKGMFVGPPGVGKTTLAHHFAARLGLHMVAVRPERLVDAYVGSTGRNIGALFDAATRASERQPVVLFLDEFEAYGLKRREARQGAEDERNAWVNTLLQRIEQYDGFIVAATNFGEAVDPAIWRRFDVQVALDIPGPAERRRILTRYLAPFGLPKRSLAGLAEACETATPALMRQLCEGLKRQLVVGPLVGWDMGREAVVGRVVAAVTPHPDVGKPRLWSLGAADSAVEGIPWPLPKAEDLAEMEEAMPSVDEDGGNVVRLDERGH